MNKLIVFENGLVPVYKTDIGEYVVDGRELWERLEVKSRFNDWINNRIEECEAVENEDFQTFTKNLVKGRPTTEYIITLDTAKEMAMLERNEIGKQLRKYFISIEKKYKQKLITATIVPFKEQVECIDIIANSLKVNDASKILMYNTLYKSYNLPANFLPKYEFNNNRELKSATELLKENKSAMSVVQFNKLMIQNGYLEEKTRTSTKGNVKKFKALSEKGLQYGENGINSYNQKEVQPNYYSDTFSKLLEIIKPKTNVISI